MRRLRILFVVGAAALSVAWKMPEGAGAPLPIRAAPAAVSRPLGDARPLIDVGVAASRRVVGLSFDDGPDPRWTPQVLDALRAEGARATFFVTGQAARAHPDLVRRIVAEGSEVANHTETHRLVEGMTVDAIVAELLAAQRSIATAGVRPVPLFRPPKGRYDASVLAATRRLGLRPVGWTVCLERWLGDGAESGVDTTATRVGSGGIVLAHDGGVPNRSATVAALPLLLGRLRADGHELVPVSEMLDAGHASLGRPGRRDPLPTFTRTPV